MFFHEFQLVRFPKSVSFILAFAISNFAQKKEFRVIENNAFMVGEKLIFDVKYGFVTAGVAIMEIPKIKNIAKRKTYHIKFNVNSVSSFDPFFKVRDRYETYLDKEGLFPWRFEQHIREGKYSRDFSAFFDQRKNERARWILQELNNIGPHSQAAS